MKGKPADRAKGGQAIVNLSAKEDDLLMLSMSYYKNQLSNFFVEETIVTHAVSYLMDKMQDEKPVVPLADVVRVSQQLMEIFRSEFIQFSEPGYKLNEEKILQTLKVGEKMKVLSINQDEGTFQLNIQKVGVMRSLLQFCREFL